MHNTKGNSTYKLAFAKILSLLLSTCNVNKHFFSLHFVAVVAVFSSKSENGKKELNCDGTLNSNSYTNYAKSDDNAIESST